MFLMSMVNNVGVIITVFLDFALGTIVKAVAILSMVTLRAFIFLYGWQTFSGLGQEGPSRQSLSKADFDDVFFAKATSMEC